MDNWQTVFLGLKQLPRELTAFEIEAFFTFSAAERTVIEARRRPELQLALALQIGFLRMSGRLLDALRIVPPELWRHLGAQFAIAPPELASLRALYRRRTTTLREHHQIACETLGFRWVSEHERRALQRAIREELARTGDRNRLLRFARRWLYEHRRIIVNERRLRSMINPAMHQFEAKLGRDVRAPIDVQLLERWRGDIVRAHDSGVTMQTWLFAPPAKHSSRQIDEMLERIEKLYDLNVHRHLQEAPEALLRRYARRLANRPPSSGARIREPARTVEVAYFLRYCLLINTDRLLPAHRGSLAPCRRGGIESPNALDGFVSGTPELGGHPRERHERSRYRGASTPADAHCGSPKTQTAHPRPTDTDKAHR